jgi:hypothetical protein
MADYRALSIATDFPADDGGQRPSGRPDFPFAEIDPLRFPHQPG